MTPIRGVIWISGLTGRLRKKVGKKLAYLERRKRKKEFVK
jgi:hypothetical protein